MVGIAAPALAVETVYTGPSGGNWDSDANWTQPGPVNVQPGTADAAIILDGSTVNINTTETVLELQVSHAANPLDTSVVHGVARLNVLPGALLTTNGNSSGIRLGRALDLGQTIGTSRGEIIQTGGSVIIQQGSNGLRLSQADGGSVGDSLYRISGGSVRGGAGADGTMVSNLALGAIANGFDEARFHVVGSGATSIRFLDVALGANTSGGGDTVIQFSLDASGVTPIIAEDELQFRGTGTSTIGNNFLEIDLIGAAPEADITLIMADRLNTNGVTNSATLERFTGMPDGTLIVRQFGGFEWTWTLEYTDGGDNSVLDASVILDFVSKTQIPEPTSLALLGVGGLAMLRRRSSSRRGR